MVPVAVFFIKLYRIMLSPFMLHFCRFYPSCSEYALDAFQKKGFLKGCYWTLFRLLRCNPFSKGGYDPVK